jgi:hypothetical protein
MYPFSSKLRWAEHVAKIEETINACSILVRESLLKCPLARQRRRGNMTLRWMEVA